MQQNSEPVNRTDWTVYQVGDLEVDVARATVTRAGVQLSLPKLSFDLLVALIEIAPAVATVDVLLDRVWPGLVVNPETVSQRVKLLRAALGDDAREPRYVLVVRGRGWRLVPRVEPRPVGPDPGHDAIGSADSNAVEPPAALPSVSARVSPPPAGSLPPATAGRTDRSAIAVLVTLLLLVVVLAWFAVSRRPEPRSAAPAVAPAAATMDRSIAVLPFESLGRTSDDDALAAGVAEAVLHQLGGLSQLVVIARTSSFAVSRQGLDATQVGRQLGARYLLEGSVQRVAARLRITAQLIDAGSGRRMWSLQFDRPSDNIFAVQDEIALNVVRALKLSLDASTTDRLTGQGTGNFDAYLEYLQARHVLAAARVVELPAAIAHLKRALQLDPDFARAYVELARAELQRAEFGATQDGQRDFERAAARAGELLEQALALDATNGRAYLQRAYLRAFSDIAAAEADYRRGLQLSPSDADGYEGLAAILYQDPRRRDEALQQLDRARRLDPLEPRYDVTRAVFLLYGRGDVPHAVELLRGVQERRPGYPPALARLGETLWCCSGELAEAIRLLEQAETLDPDSGWVRQLLATAYLSIGDARAAASVLGPAGAGSPEQSLQRWFARGDWRRAGELAYAVLRDGPVLGTAEDKTVFAIRMHARTTGDFRRARDALAKLAGVRWNERDEPVYEPALDLKSAIVGLADMLLQLGEQARAIRLLRQVGTDIDHEVRDLRRGELWYSLARPISAALLGDDERALALLRASASSGFLHHAANYHLAIEPAFERLRGDPRYRALLQSELARVDTERATIEQWRRQGIVPARGH
jgi:TolB-like protein/DNA-binding winged helix-turn-helix (wHTH) protein/Tfp pilus assembly protein PilF